MRFPTARLVLALAAFCCAGLPGCVTPAASRAAPPMALHQNVATMKEEVLRHVAVGTPIDEAKGVMEAHGFRCSYRPYNDWERSRVGDAATGGPEEVCLVCSKFMPRSGGWLERLLISDEIKVYFFFDGGKVTEVRVDHVCTAP